MDARNLVLFAFHVQTAVLSDNDVCSNRSMKAIDELFAAPKWTQSFGEEIANSISHGLGLLAGLIGAPILMLAAWRGATVAVTRAKYKPALYDDERQRARAATGQARPAPQPGSGVVVLNNWKNSDR